MAPKITIDHLPRAGLPIVAQRDGRSSTGEAAFDPVQAASVPQIQGAVSAPGQSPTMYLAIGIAVGGVMLVAMGIVVRKIILRRNEHKRAMVALEQQQIASTMQGSQIDVSEVPRPVQNIRRGSLVLIHAIAGSWDALSSSEELRPDHAVAGGKKKKKRSSMSIPKYRLPLKRLKHLSAIIESPRSRATRSPSPPAQVSALRPAKQRESEQKAVGRNKKANNWAMATDEDVFMSPGSPKPSVLPSFAIRSPGAYGVTFVAEDVPPKASRSWSMGAFPSSIPVRKSSEQQSQQVRPQMHTRSISLGAPTSLPPSGPVPPLPVIAPHDPKVGEARQGLCVSRLSTSSEESTSSSVLVTSPLVRMNDDSIRMGSPSLEQLVTDDDSAQLKVGASKQWQQSPMVAKSPSVAEQRSSKARASVESKTAQYGRESVLSNQLSTCSTAPSLDDHHNRLSIPQIITADRVSISRVSSNNSLKGQNGVQKITTPRKVSRVSTTGSPAERKKTNVLRDISGNSMGPSRQASSATQDSTRSSNGNPFQWDSIPLAKPSALKGSPNARKGHRRQNCVRISTLTPQILGPPPSRPTSPVLMHGIEEEPYDYDENSQFDNSGMPFVSHQRRSRPSSMAFVYNVRMSTLRASLTPSSPTVSTWNAYQEHGLPSQYSDSQLSAISDPATRPASRQSALSSILSIPSFPSPSKTTVAAVQLDQPIPEFSISRPSGEMEEDEYVPSPVHLQFPFDTEVPSSPPMSVSKSQEYDPAWPMISIPAPNTSHEYDPARPAFVNTDPERSSPMFASTVTLSPSQSPSPRSRPSSCAVDSQDTPPCSPKSMPVGFGSFFDRSSPKEATLRAAEKLTSENASTLMARFPTVDFPGAPILLPPIAEPLATTPIRQRTFSISAKLQPVRPAPPPPMPSSDKGLPSSLQVKQHSPLGPRSEPGKSVLKNAAALRRMNSEIDWSRNRESRRYARLGREASPILPWIGSPDLNESCNDLFDFEFASGEVDTAGGAAETKSALDEVDITEVSRQFSGAIAGFEVPKDEDREDRNSSVWEDGENFWQERLKMSQYTLKSSSPVSDADDVTPTPTPRIPAKSADRVAPNKDAQVKRTPTRTRGIVAEIAALHGPTRPSLRGSGLSTIGESPRSLYDVNGFLRT